MENNNYSYSSYPDSTTSTPRSGEVDCETDQQQLSDYKVKLMCSYGGKILPRPHDNQLTYIGGDTKILTVDRNIRFASVLHKLNSLTNSSDFCFKYQLPGEDLDALISVTNDEDLEHMMTEYDRIFRSSVKPVRLRLFMFPSTFAAAGGGGGESKTTEQQWFVDALNAVQISSSQGSLPASENNPDFLFGFDKGNAPAKAQDVVLPHTNARPGSECGSEDSNSNRHVISDPVEIQKQMHESQTMQVAASHEQARAYYGDYYTQKIQPRYWQEQQAHMTSGGYQMSVSGTDSPVYLIPSSAGVYPPLPAAAQTVRPATQGQSYYGMQRMVNNPTEMYSTMTHAQIEQPKVGTYQEAIGMVMPQGQGYYYTTSQIPTYQQQQVVDMRQGPVLAVNQDGKMVVNSKNNSNNKVL